MIYYQITPILTKGHYIKIEMEFKADKADRSLRLALWRPGRYENQNFASSFRTVSQIIDNEVIELQKLDNNSWSFKANNGETVKVVYEYYASTLNAGGSWSDMDMLYLNPINCCLFYEPLYYQAHDVKLNISSKFMMETSLNLLDWGYFEASSFDELADSPIIASPYLKRHAFKVEKQEFKLVFYSFNRPPFETIKNDFEKFIRRQLELFKEFPFTKPYLFINIILPNKAYHGVEHLHSTVITLGPEKEIFSTLYTELLGISSHELFHAWNVKTIRPKEYAPYDLTKSIRSKLGFVYEGFTTYYGDLELLRSNCFDWKQYQKEFNTLLSKHLINDGRMYKSVMDSSADTWVDGYLNDTPNRKVSIYNEGALGAYCLDMTLRMNNVSEGLDSFMLNFYNDKNSRNYEFKDLVRLLNQITKLENGADLLNELFGSNVLFEEILPEFLSVIGLELVSLKTKESVETLLNISIAENGMVNMILEGSQAAKAGITRGDKIIRVNDVLYGRIDHSTFWDNLEQDLFHIEFSTMLGRKKEVTFEGKKGNKFQSYLGIEKLKKASSAQKENFKIWAKQDF